MDFDSLAMGFDGYRCKRVEVDELRNLVETPVLRREFNEVIREYFARVSKITALQHRKTADELDGNEAYEQTSGRLEEINGRAPPRWTRPANPERSRSPIRRT